MILDLTETERKILEDALSSELAEVRIQIAETDRVDHRDLLRRRKNVISKVLDTLRASPTSRSSSGLRRTTTVRGKAAGGSNAPASGAH